MHQRISAFVGNNGKEEHTIRSLYKYYSRGFQMVFAAAESHTCSLHGVVVPGGTCGKIDGFKAIQTTGSEITFQAFHRRLRSMCDVFHNEARLLCGQVHNISRTHRLVLLLQPMWVKGTAAARVSKRLFTPRCILSFEIGKGPLRLSLWYQVDKAPAIPRHMGVCRNQSV